MQAGSSCCWFLLKQDDIYAIQYTGQDPDIELPQELEGPFSLLKTLIKDDDLLHIMESLHENWMGEGDVADVMADTEPGSATQSLSPLKKSVHKGLIDEDERLLQDSVLSLHITPSIPRLSDTGENLDTRLAAAKRLLDEVIQFSLTQDQKILLHSLVEIYGEKLQTRTGIPMEVTRSRYNL